MAKSIINIDMTVSGNLINAYYICPRKAWFFGRKMYPQVDFGNLEVGRLITREAYKREKKEVDFDNLKFDLIKTIAGNLVVGEVKKSSRGIEAARKQVLYYLLRLKEVGVDATGEILVPKEKLKEKVVLTAEAESELKKVIFELETLVKCDTAPLLEKCKYCKKCAYNDFCWAEIVDS